MPLQRRTIKSIEKYGAPMTDIVSQLTAEEALALINQLRNNVIATQNCSWSNMTYPLVAILSAAGYEYEEPTDAAQKQHLRCYGGAGGYPGKLK